MEKLLGTENQHNTVFSLSPKPQKARLGGHQEPNPTYLGVKFDPRLTWNVHTEQCRNKGLHRAALLKKLAVSNWGADNAVLRKAYIGYARPVLEHNMAAWSTTSDSNFNKICRVQNENLRIMTGALKSTLINDMETITGIESMGDRREVKQVIQLDKMKRLQHHPMRERVTTGTQSRLKRLSFLHKARKSSQDLEIPAQDRPQPMNTTSSIPWSMQKKPEIRDSIEEVGTKTQVPMEQLTRLTQKYIEHHFPYGEWIRVYTDGSVTEGGGVYIQWPDGTSESHAIPTGLFSSNYRAEIAALEEAASILKNHSKTLKYRVVLLRDAKSVLQALAPAKCPPTEQLLAALCQLHSIALTVVQWIPGHSNSPGKDQADSLAKEGAKLPQIEK